MIKLIQKTVGLTGKHKHRGRVGGMWEEIGTLQFDYMVNIGLTPEMYLLDVGCGCLRGGIHFIQYLAPSHYFGIDISQQALDAGYKYELGELGLQQKLPYENLLCTGEFDARRFGITFDKAIAQSLFTHLPLNQIRLCLTRLADVVRIGGVLHATVFLSPEDHDWSQPLLHDPGGITTFPADDPYHYRVEDLEYCAAGLPWQFDLVGDWDHPRNQSMTTFTRTETVRS